MQGYRDRVRFLEHGRHDWVYDGGGNSTATIIENGRIIGVWQFTKEPSETVRYHLFTKRPHTIRRAAEERLARAADLYFEREVDIIEVRRMKPLSADGGRSAAHPLDSRPHRPSKRAG